MPQGCKAGGWAKSIASGGRLRVQKAGASLLSFEHLSHRILSNLLRSNTQPNQLDHPKNQTKMYTTLITLAATVATVAALPQQFAAPSNTTSTGEGIEICGSQPYYPSNYTCYDNEFLCPVLENRRTQVCGDACFDPNDYK